jgi:hypothetical protein
MDIRRGIGENSHEKETAMSEWTSPTRKPRAHEVVICRTEDGREFHGLCWSTSRAEFIEPISNRSAEAVIGKIAGWRYPEPEADATPSP